MVEKILSETVNGQVFLCNQCNKLHIEYGNFSAIFCRHAFFQFLEAVEGIEEAYYEKINRHTGAKRKIIIPMADGPCCFVFILMKSGSCVLCCAEWSASAVLR